jgi:predicted DNA-binding transcriptional regulator AlpA
MSTTLKAAANGRIPSAPSVPPCHAAASVNADLLDRRAVCRMFGGSKPINASTLYRGIRRGRFPRPIRIGGSSRWLRDECEVVLRGMMEARS